MATWRKDVRADRWTPFKKRFAFLDKDYTGATFAAQVRANWDAEGSAIVSLSTVGGAGSEGVWLDYAGTDTVLNHIAAGRLPEVPAGLTDSTSVAVSVIGIRINETTMETAFDEPDDDGDEFVCVWDLHITPSGDLKFVAIRGTFTVVGGATQ